MIPVTQPCGWGIENDINMFKFTISVCPMRLRAKSEAKASDIQNKRRSEFILLCSFKTKWDSFVEIPPPLHPPWKKSEEFYIVYSMWKSLIPPQYNSFFWSLWLNTFISLFWTRWSARPKYMSLSQQLQKILYARAVYEYHIYFYFLLTLFSYVLCRISH